MSRTVLCIDDDRALADVLEVGAPADELRVLHASDPEEALRRVAADRPDLVLLELAPTGDDALGLVERIRGQDEGSATLPVVVVSKQERTPELFARAVQLGVEEILTQPISSAQLVECVRESLARRKAVLPADLSVEGPSEEGLSAGKLEDLPLPEVLQRLHQQGRSGVLIVGDAQERTGIQIRNGSPVAVGLNGGETIEDYLVRTERISAVDRDRAQNELSLGLSTAEDVLLGMGVIDEAGFEEAVRERAEEALFALFERERGRYRFERGRRLKSEKSVDIHRSARNIIVRGVLARSSMTTVRAALERYADLYAVGSPKRLSSDDVPCSPAQREFIASLGGDRAVAEFLDASEFEQRTLYAFAIVGAIDLCMLLLEDVLEEAPAAVDPPDPTETPEAAEPAETTGEAGGADEARPSAAEAPPAQRPPGEGHTEHERRLAVLPFASLRQDASELEALTRRVKTRLARTLGNRLTDDPDDTQTLPGVDADLGDSASRALDAETWFRKGQDFLKSRKYPEAVEAFGMSAHLDPREGEYVAHLGYALYLSKPDDELVRKEALEDIARGVKLSPDRETSYVFMGRIFKVMGDIQVARKMFSRALVIRPHCREASQELRLIEMREKKNSGFLSRLRSR